MEHDDDLMNPKGLVERVFSNEGLSIRVLDFKMNVCFEQLFL